MEKLNLNFDLAIDKNKFESLLEESVVDNLRPNARKLFGSWIKLFENQIIDKERATTGLEVSLVSNMAKFYPNRKRSDAAFFRGNASCKNKSCTATYSLSILDKPIDLVSKKNCY
ncbi:unnamed protein product [Brachionus calyciflorus]|uniref:Uncharacterized protein n=1 Tax=Brachionus calyciflorus TaxID=104777 RepID=A0A813VKT7_9BILA|nr:unnamed protein product [Brachionus calyciflorus]